MKLKDWLKEKSLTRGDVVSLLFLAVVAGFMLKSLVS